MKHTLELQDNLDAASRRRSRRSAAEDGRVTAVVTAHRRGVSLSEP